MRLSIARDLHDDVGASLGSIGLLSDLVERSLPPGARAQQPVRQIRASVAGTTQALRDVIWLIDPKHDDAPDDLVYRMRQASADLLRGHSYTFDVEDALGKLALGMEARRHIYLIYKEALHNVVKHANATRVAVRVAQEQAEGRRTTLYITVRDNGYGFDLAARSEGYGLRNMRQRAEAIGASLDIAVEQGGGTRLTLSVPLRSRWYAKLSLPWTVRG
jgi:signal transduction histidine kinase